MRDLSALMPGGQLVNECEIPGTSGLRPHPYQGLSLIRPLLESAVSGTSPWGRVGTTVVLAMDGVGLDLAETAVTPDRLYALTSTFPSTSSVAWLTSVTGRQPGDHRVAGVVYEWPGSGRLFYTYPNRLYDWDGETNASGVVQIGPYSTAFSSLRTRGFTSHVLLGDLINYRGAWLSALTHGATSMGSHINWDGLTREPTRMVELIATHVEQVIASASPPDLLWVYLNFDAYLHHALQDDEISSALEHLSRRANRWAQQGHAVIAYSDHGNTRNLQEAQEIGAWMEATDSSLCRLPPGGAGRVRWCYVRQGQIESVYDRLSRALSDARVVLRDEFLQMGLLPPDMREMAGEVVCIADGVRFPAPNPEYRHEHGSWTMKEMLVPLANWEPR